MIRAAVFDVGETLIGDDRYWSDWADWLGVRRHTLSALVGAVVARGGHNQDALPLVRPGIDVAAEWRAREAAGLGEVIDESDLYPDVRGALAALRSSGVWVGIAGNQSSGAGRCLRALDLPCDALAVSGDWGVEKPSPAFFERLADWVPAEPGETVYVGDHPANDLLPAREAGFRTAHVRRGALGHFWAGTPSARADWNVDGLDDLASHLTGRPAGEERR
ncbi:HAD family hydrolase [Streptomyces sp. NPDC056600]|uniref:HAD family hydrolase n=1 Tax=Streptomyces sp. NPDC056600 TaxID=3345874 RepID=UPI0036C5B66E